ncbi:MAG: DUF6622 family protein [Burkholderiales bacterium]
MNTSPPLSIVVVEILRHTPHWVWLILAAITLLGALQLRQYRISRGRLLLAPIALGAYSLWGASSAFGAAAVPAWLAGMALTLLASRALRGPRTIEVAADGRFVLPGSPWPLLLMWAIFGLRYAVAVTLVFHPAWAHGGAMAVGVATLYGALFGLFAARAWRVLQSARWPGSVQVA